MITGIDPGQLRLYVIRRVLESLAPEIPYSLADENLVLGTAIHESHLIYLDQKDKAAKPGPAYGLWQIEARTYRDLWARMPKTLMGKVSSYKLWMTDELSASELHGNLFLGAAMCRVFYRLLPDRIPSDPAGMAALWKLRYNTYKGAGTIAQALPAFELACKVGL